MSVEGGPSSAGAASTGLTAKDIFLEAAELDQARRGALLDERCGADAALREQVMSLLAAHDSAGAFLAEPSAVPTNSGSIVTGRMSAGARS